jgi:hypothetical protein
LRNPCAGQPGTVWQRITLDGKTLERMGGNDFAGKSSHAGSGWNPATLGKVFTAKPETPFEIWFQLRPLQSPPDLQALFH